MKKTLLLSAFLIGIAAAAFAGALKTREYTLLSPDQKLKAVIRIDSTIWFELYRNGTPLMSSEAIGLKLPDGTFIGINPVVKKTQEIKVDQVVKPEIREKSESIRDNYQELKLMFKPDYSLEFRMYNEGMAYRIILNRPGDLVIENELGGYRFDAKDSVCLALEKS
ncbi:MAG: glycoside hydrolase family 97 N-terminal domain-containing protein [Bacteroidia bacterium]|nr:glycoside hydrolase family 97 N-terminal domain-containing protein [Bacteroidia bacterium]